MLLNIDWRPFMRKRDELKRLLIEIKTNNCCIPEEIDTYELSLDMLNYLGDTDSELRDKLIYTIFWNIYKRRDLTVDQMKNILNIALGDDYLFYGIDKNCDDSVFKRAFTTLILSITLNANNHEEFLSESEVLHVFEKFLDYFKLELDKRGFVDGKGWADSTCHGADVIYNLGSSRVLNKDHLVTLLDLIKEKVCVNDITYINEEDERFIGSFSGIYERGLFTSEEIIKWVERFKNFEKINQYPEDLRILINIKHFLRSLYFYFKKRDDVKNILLSIEDTLESIK